MRLFNHYDRPTRGTNRGEEMPKSPEVTPRPMTEAIHTLITPLILGREAGEPVFPEFDFRAFWKRICEGIATPGRKGICFHDFRRSAARAKRAAGVSESTIMDIAGWRTSGMFRRYAINDNTDRLDALQKQEASHLHHGRVQ